MPRDREIIQKQLISLMRQPHYMPLRKRKLAKKLNIPESDYVDFRHLVDDLVGDGKVTEVRRGKYGLTSKASPSDLEGKQAGPKKEHALPKNTLIGRIEVKRGGFGFLLSDPPGNDLYLKAEDLGGALNGDLVAVAPKRKPQGKKRRGFRPGGRVIKVLERAHLLIVGTYHSHKPSKYDPPQGPGGFVHPDTRGLFDEIDILPGDAGEAQDGDKVAVELFEPEKGSRTGRRIMGKVMEVYGEAGEARAEIASIIENFSLRTSFSEASLNQAEALSEDLTAEELARRVDYTSPLTFTIDPPDAKDHDDAVALRDLGGGRTELLVHIADVSHYIPFDSPIDREARERSCSAYLPGRVLPMLPEKLSTNMCSLKEGKRRLTKTCAITFRKDFSVDSVKIQRSYITSAAFLHYDQVKEALEAEDPSLLPSQELYDTLVKLRTFAAGLRKKRLSTGSIDLDLPEVHVLTDEDDKVTGITKRSGHWAHQLIEDMMLAANRAVATYMFEHEIPGLFRVHPEPEEESLAKFSEFVEEYGLRVKLPYDRKMLVNVLQQVKGKDYQHAVHLALLTSLKQAVYSSECQPHFALNFMRYLHFTSPIRRYPDLVVHRALDALFPDGKSDVPVGPGSVTRGRDRDDYWHQVSQMRSLAMHCSKRERDAAEAEREVTKVQTIQFLRENARDNHEGIITGVRDFGLFVELQDCYVDGLVRVQDLTDDWYEYYQDAHLLQGRRSGRGFRLGDKVTVRVVHIDVGQRRVGLMIV